MIRKHIHFVCTGNTCRSPMAEGITRSFLLEAGLGEKWTVSSSGLASLPGDPASPHVGTVLKEMGIDISGHRSSRTSSYAIGQACYVFAMTRGHLAHLRRLFPEAEERIMLFSEVIQRARECSCDPGCSSDPCPVEQEIPDPYGQDLSQYRRTARLIAFYARLLVCVLRSEESGCGGSCSG